VVYCYFSGSDRPLRFHTGRGGGRWNFISAFLTQLKLRAQTFENIRLAVAVAKTFWVDADVFNSIELVGWRCSKGGIPVRAHDAVIVPLRIKQLQDHRIDRLKLIIDENPAPMATEFSFGPDMYPLQFEARVRVARYSNLRVIATLHTGKDYMVGGFIKASGGCSAPAGKDPAAFAKTFGQIKVKKFSGGDTLREAIGSKPCHVEVGEKVCVTARKPEDEI
jgi:hypothetical protein